MDSCPADDLTGQVSRRCPSKANRRHSLRSSQQNMDFQKPQYLKHSFDAFPSLRDARTHANARTQSVREPVRESRQLEKQYFHPCPVSTDAEWSSQLLIWPSCFWKHDVSNRFPAKPHKQRRRPPSQVWPLTPRFSPVSLGTKHSTHETSLLMYKKKRDKLTN